MIVAQCLCAGLLVIRPGFDSGQKFVPLDYPGLCIADIKLNTSIPGQLRIFNKIYVVFTEIL